jgi:hypothetical protein
MRRQVNRAHAALPELPFDLVFAVNCVSDQTSEIHLAFLQTLLVFKDLMQVITPRPGFLL